MEINFTEEEMKVIVKHHVLRMLGAHADGKNIEVTGRSYQSLECEVRVTPFDYSQSVPGVLAVPKDYSEPLKRGTAGLAVTTGEGDLDVMGRRLVPGS